MYIFLSNLSIEVCKDIFHSKVKTYKVSPSYGLGLMMPNDYIGRLEGENFWLQKLSPRFFNLPARKFVGCFIRQECGTGIEGRFHFLKLQKYSIILFLSIALFIIGRSMLSSVVDMFKTNSVNISGILPYIVIILFFFGVSLGTLALTIKVYEREERELLKFILSVFECDNVIKTKQNSKERKNTEIL